MRTLVIVRTLGEGEIKKRVRTDGERTWNGKKLNKRVGLNLIDWDWSGVKTSRVLRSTYTKWESNIVEMNWGWGKKKVIDWQWKMNDIELGKIMKTTRKWLAWRHEMNVERTRRVKNGVF